MFRLMSILALVAALGTGEKPQPVWQPTTKLFAATSDIERGATATFGDVPLTFVPNAGQTDARVRYVARAAGASFFFTPNEAVMSLTNGTKGYAVRLSFLDANASPEIRGSRPAAGRVNHLIGRDRSRWRTALPTFGEVVYQNLWAGIDLAFRGEESALKYEFRLAPGADANAIHLAYRGADRLSLEPSGELRIHTSLGVLRDGRPLSYQMVGGAHVPVDSRYELAGDGYRFQVGDYDRSLPLVIDPGLAYSTFLGGSGFEEARDIAVDVSGNAYVTGVTLSPDFPVSPGAFDPTLGGTNDVFVTKLDSSGALIYSTYLGGSGTPGEGADAIAVDALGSAYIIGSTFTPDFPTTPGSFNPGPFVGGMFVTKLTPDGDGLVYSTFVGGGLSNLNGDIAVDSAGSAYVTGLSSGVFVIKVNPAGSALDYSTFLGGSGSVNWGRGIAVDSSGSAYVTGLTTSTDFPVTPGAFDTTCSCTNGIEDTFVTKLNPSGALVYSTFLGGINQDQGLGIAVDGSGNAYVTGLTTSSNFPTTPGAFDRIIGGKQDAFVTKLNPTGTALVYSTFLGSSTPPTSVGGAFDHATAIAVDSFGAAYVTGRANGPDFPLTPGAIDTTVGSNDVPGDAFLTKLNPSGSALDYSTYLGGSDDDLGQGIAIDGLGNAYVAGSTRSSDFPTTPGAFDTTKGATVDAFVAKVNIENSRPLPATLTLTSPLVVTVGTMQTVTATVEDSNGQPVGGVIVRFSITGAVSTSGQCTTGTDGQCSFSYHGPTTIGSDGIGAFADTDGDSVADSGEPTAGATTMWIAGAPATVTINPQADSGIVGSVHCMIAMVADAYGNGTPGQTVRFTVAGAVNVSGTAVTDANGQATFCYTGPDFPGADGITAHVDLDGDGVADNGEPIVNATKTWLLPDTTLGQVTGGGQAPTLNGEIAFGFNAKSNEGRLLGHCNVVDHASSVHLTCVDVTSLVVNGTRATIFGTGTINGTPMIYRIDVEDQGEPGADRDMFTIVTSTGYSAGGLIARGNIQVPHD